LAIERKKMIALKEWKGKDKQKEQKHEVEKLEQIRVPDETRSSVCVTEMIRATEELAEQAKGTAQLEHVNEIYYQLIKLREAEISMAASERNESSQRKPSQDSSALSVAEEN